jgi:hypothetical protein
MAKLNKAPFQAVSRPLPDLYGDTAGVVLRRIYTFIPTLALGPLATFIAKRFCSHESTQEKARSSHESEHPEALPYPGSA